MIEISKEDFRQMVADELDQLDTKFLKLLDNVVFITTDRCQESGKEDILGMYEGYSLPERGSYGYGEEPDKIALFRLPFLEKFDSVEEIKKEIRVTLIHEISHYHGLTEERIHELGWG